MGIKITYLMLIGLLFSCNKESGVDEKHNCPTLNIYANAEGENKIITSFGIYALSGDTYVYNNAEFILKTDVYTSREDLDFMDDIDELVIYAYSPYTETAVNIETEELNFEINSDQRALADFDASDFLFAKQVTGDFKSPVDMKFDHTLSQLEIRLTAKTAQNIINSDIEAKLTGQYTNVNINISNGNIGATSEKSDIYMYVNPKSGGGNIVEGIYCNLIPTQLKAGENICNLKIGKEQYAISSAVDININKGQRTIINVLINDTDAQVTSNFNINNWISTEDVNCDMEVDPGETSVKDVEGNSYKILKFGAYFWMAQNLRTTKYNDGTEIPYINNSDAWQTLTSGAFCTYNHAELSVSNNHFFYNHFAVETEKLCPKGWSVPSLRQWYDLADALGGATTAGRALKSIAGWDLNTNGTSGNGTNASQMNISPQGAMETVPKFYGKNAYFWTATPHETTLGMYHAVYLAYNSDALKNWGFGAKKIRGYSIRCIKPVN